MILLARERVTPNHKPLRRVRLRSGSRCADVAGASGRSAPAPMTLRQAPNRRRILDVVADALASGRRFRVLAVVDDFTWLGAWRSSPTCRRRRVARGLDATMADR